LRWTEAGKFPGLRGQGRAETFCLKREDVPVSMGLVIDNSAACENGARYEAALTWCKPAIRGTKPCSDFNDDFISTGQGFTSSIRS